MNIRPDTLCIACDRIIVNIHNFGQLKKFCCKYHQKKYYFKTHPEVRRKSYHKYHNKRLHNDPEFRVKKAYYYKLWERSRIEKSFEQIKARVEDYLLTRFGEYDSII